MSAAFTMAPASERTLDAGAYLIGVLELALILGAVAFAAWRLRMTILPGWRGAPGRLVESVLAIAALLWLAEALGTFGAHGELTMIVASLVLALASAVVCPRIDARREPGPVASLPAPPASKVATWIAAVACAAVAAAWAVPTLAALAGGMDRADTLWYHMPLSARFASSGDLGAIHFFDPIFFASFYPANSEVLHSIGLLTFDRDIVSPLFNLAFLALGLLACYCIGRPWGVGPQSLLGGAIGLGAQMLIEFQAGEALNDIVGVAFILAAVAIMVDGRVRGNGRLPEVGGNGRIPRAALATAGIAAGLAAGTKFSFLAPAFALMVGLVVIAPRGLRIRAGLWFALPGFAAGGYWYLRNLFAIGNPIPFTSFGPLGLPAPERVFELREGFSIAHYWNDPGVWADWFFPGLNQGFGFLWPLTIAAFVGAGAVALWRGGEPMVRMLGAVVVFTAAAYLVTPLTAAGEEGMPIAFEWNLRYLAPAAVVGLALLPCVPLARDDERARRRTLIGLTVLFAATIVSLVQWQQGHVKGAVGAGIGVLVAFALVRRLRRCETGAALSRRLALRVAGAVVVVVLGAGWWMQNHYLERRYESLSPAGALAEAVRWARDLRGARVAVGGVRGVFNQYPFYGTALANEVQWLGEEGADGAFHRIGDCVGWRAALADGDYTHVVTTYDPFRPTSLTDTKEAVWTREDPGAREIVRDGPVSVFELEATPAPQGCERLPELSEAELNGDSANIEPTANQP